MSYLIVIGRQPDLVQVRPGVWVVRPPRTSFVLRELSPQETKGDARVVPGTGKARAAFAQFASEDERDAFVGRYRLFVTGAAWQRTALVNRLTRVVTSAHSPVDEPALRVGTGARFRAWVLDTFWGGSRATRKDPSKKSPRP